MSDLPIEAHGDHAHPHATHTGHRWFDITMALTAIFISVVSLYVAIEHGKTERELVAANSWPFPQSLKTDRFEDRPAVAFGIINSGTGPAKIYSYEVFLDGRPIASPVDLLRKCCGLPSDPKKAKVVLPEGSIGMSEVNASVLRPGQTKAILQLKSLRDTKPVADRLGLALQRISFRVCYCSILDECWKSDIEHLKTQRVKECLPVPHPYYFSDRPQPALNAGV